MWGRSNRVSRGPKDRTRVDPNHDWECLWWSKGFGVSVDELRAAVKEVGPLVADLDYYLLGSRSVV
jgi:hypothetical protein